MSSSSRACMSGMLVAQHEGFVDAGEGLVLRVFEQAGGAHGQRIAHFLEKRFQICRCRATGKSRVQKALLDFGVVVAVQREVAEIVLGQEVVEHVRGENDRGRHRDADAGKACARCGAVRRRWRTKARPRALPPSEPAPMRRKLESDGLNVSALEVADQRLRSARGGSRRWTRSDRGADARDWRSRETLRGRSLCARANSVRAISQCEK